MRAVDECDVLIGMSGMSAAAATRVRERFGAKIWIERGSRHILSQRRILDAIPSGSRRGPAVTDFAVERELADYATADRVAVPSSHVQRSFIEEGFPADNIFVNPYGVDLTMFPALEAAPPVPPTILMAGMWSGQKGCDVLTAAWRSLRGVRLVHVGPVGDVALPTDERFTHYDAVDQAHLKEFYSLAHVVVLPSRQDGFGLVLLQSLACARRIVCTNRTGGEDLKAMVPEASTVTVVPADDAPALATALREALDAAIHDAAGPRDLLGPSRANFSWAAYAKRYSDELQATTARCG